MAITKVPSDMIQVANNVTDTTIGGANSGVSVTFDSLGVISAASNVALSINTADISDSAVTDAKISAVANSKITGVMTTAQMADEAITASKLATTVAGALGVRNLIINGDMRIAQRGTIATNITIPNYLTVDRWKQDNYNAGIWSMEQDTDVPNGQGFSKSLKMTCTTAQASLPADARLQQGYRIEGQHLQHLKYGSSSAESVTLSFWVKTNKTGTYVINLYDLDNSKNIGSQYTVSSADTWEKKTLTFSGNTLNNFDNDNNLSLFIEFWFGAGTNFTSGTLPSSWSAASNANRAANLTVNLADSTSNYINITGVQLEVGDTATPFEHRPYDMELARCMRYYQKSYNYADVPGAGTFSDNDDQSIQISWGSLNTSTIAGGCMLLPVTLRAIPTLTIYDGNNNIGKVTLLDGGSNPTHNVAPNVVDCTTKRFNFRVYANSQCGMYFAYKVEAEL